MISSGKIVSLFSSMLHPIQKDKDNVSADGKISFKGLSVNANDDLSCTYFPATKRQSKVTAIGFSVVPIEKRVIMTFYYNPRDKHFSFYEADPKIKSLYNHVIWHQDPDHQTKFHKRVHPLDEHVHYSCYLSDLENGTADKLLIKAIGLSDLEPGHYEQLVRGVSRLAEYPDEPGFSYLDGSFLQNGGSKDLHDTEAQDEQYIHGPYTRI